MNKGLSLVSLVSLVILYIYKDKYFHEKKAAAFAEKDVAHFLENYW